jgi:pyruvate-ferredoxin/flavodoxin oxidoreductase
VLFKRKTKSAPPIHRFEGIAQAIDGYSAATEAARLADAAIAVERGQERHGGIVSENGKDLYFREVEDGRELIGLASGFSLAGRRFSAFMGGKALADSHVSLMGAAGNRLSFVINLICDLHGGHDEYHVVADTGVFQLLARNVQEAVDFQLIAHRIAELSLNPGICAQDAYHSAHSVQTIRMPEARLVESYLGYSEDLIESPTPAQKVLFGDERRRIPELLNVDRPMGSGAVRGRESCFKGLAAQRAYFFSHIAELTDRAMKEFSDLTGRYYERASGYRIDDAEYLVIAQGAIVEDLETSVDYLRTHENVRVGILNLTMFRPFPVDLITNQLKGKKAVTVLERVHQPLSEDLPILKEVRSAIDKAIENGATGNGKRPYPDHAVYERLTDRPPLFSGVYGVGGENPSHADLVAACKNMLPEREGKKFYYLGVQFTRPDVRLPELERLQQKLARGYPNLDKLSLVGDDKISIRSKGQRRFEIHSLGGWDGSLAGDMLARALFEALDWKIKSTQFVDTLQGLRHSICMIAHSVDESDTGILAEETAAILAANAALLKHDSVISSLTENGVLVIQSELEADNLWKGFSGKVRRRLADRKIRVYFINSLDIADELAPDIHSVKLLASQALVGAFLSKYTSIESSKLDRIYECCQEELEGELDLSKNLIEDCRKAMARGAEKVAELDWQSLPPVEEKPVPEPEAPWTVRETKLLDGTLYDSARFWDSVGYLYETGRQEQALADPFLATGMVPARSTSRNLASVRTKIPRLIAENCTACGLCWTHCPDSALPATIQDLAALVNSVVKQCEADGHFMVQAQRMSEHLVRQANKLIAKDDLHQYRDLGDLLKDAFSRLIELMKPKEDQRKVLDEQFEKMHVVARSFPVVRTDTFFVAPDKQEEGSGLLFSMAVNPDTCTQCGLCVNVCPEDAIEMVEQDDELLDDYRNNWHFLMDLPDVASDRLQKFVSQDEPENLVYHLLNKKVYHSCLGGDTASPGSGVKAAIHIFAATIEAAMQPRIQRLIEKLSDLIRRVEDKIQGRVEGSIHINDFEIFAKRLAEIEGKELSVETLSDLIGEREGDPRIDKKELQLLTGLLSRLKLLRQAYVEGASGDGRARMAVTMSAAGHPRFTSIYPSNPYAFPWILHPGDDAPAVAEGAFEGIMRKMTADFKDIRMSELLLDDTYEPGEHDPFFDKFGWRDFTDEERRACPPMVVFMENDFDGISDLLLSRIPIKILAIDTKAQASAVGPGESGLQKGPTTRKEPGLLGLAHRNAFVLQSTSGNPGHLMKGIMEGMEFEGPALFHIYASEPQSHGIAPNQGPGQMKLAIESRVFPLFKYNPAPAEELVNRLDLQGNPELESDWTPQVLKTKDSGGVESGIKEPFTFADWAVREGRFRQHFNFVPRKEWDGTMMPLSEYLSLPLEDRVELKPYIQVVGREEKVMRMTVSLEMAAETEDRLAFWHLLQELSGVRSTISKRAADELQRELEQELQRAKKEVSTDYETKISQLQKDHERIYQEKLAQKLLALSGYSLDSKTLEMSLREFVKHGTTSQNKE